MSFISTTALPSPLFYISPHVNEWSIFKARWAQPQGIWHTGSNLDCCFAWAVTKTIPLPPGPSIVPLQQAKTTLGNPLKCLFGPVAGALHLTDMMRKGKWHRCWLSRMGFEFLGVCPVTAPQWGHREREGGCKGCILLSLAPPSSSLRSIPEAGMHALHILWHTNPQV